MIDTGIDLSAVNRIAEEFAPEVVHIRSYIDPGGSDKAFRALQQRITCDAATYLLAMLLGKGR